MTENEMRARLAGCTQIVVGSPVVAYMAPDPFAPTEWKGPWVASPPSGGEPLADRITGLEGRMAAIEARVAEIERVLIGCPLWQERT